VRRVVPLDALRERQFRLLFFARTASVLGDNVAPVALAFAILDLTGSATDLGLVLAARTIPLVVFLLAGGVWADWVPRQRLMLASDVGRFVTQAAFAALLLSGTAHLWELVALQALNGFATAFFQPASSGLIPQTVSPRLIQQANALISLTTSSAGIVGPAIAGILVATAGAGWAIALDAVTFAVSAAFMVPLRLPTDAERIERQTFWRDLADGWQEVRSRTWVWASVLDYMLFQLLVLGTLFVLGPLVAKESLGGATAWAIITVAIGVGSVVGDLLALQFEPRRSLLVSHVLLPLVVPVLVALGLAAPTSVIAVCAALYGATMTFASTLYFTALQEHVPERSLSRVASYDWMGSTVLRPVGYALAGPVAAALGVRATLVGAAVLTVLAQAVMVSLPAVRSLARPPLPEEEPVPVAPAGIDSPPW
jgi:MFS family permease